MKSNYFAQITPGFRVLSDSQIDDVHSASLEILWRTGTRIHNQDALDLLIKAGAPVTDGNLVRLSPHLVEWAIRTAPSRVVLANREGKRVLFLEGNNTYYGTGSDCPNILDSETGERRPVKKVDVEKGMWICDALPNIDFVMSMGLVSDVPVKTSDRHQYEAMLLNTVKPIIFTAHDLAGIRDIVEMSAIAVGGMDELRKNPNLILYAEPVTPLEHSQESIEKFLYMVENGLPVMYTPGMLKGGTAPITVAGCIALANAESLAGLLIAQLKREGAPVVLGGGALVMDLRTTVSCYGAPELQLAGAALADMANHYGLPRFSSAGASDSKIVDQQAMIEGTISAMVQALCGANLVHDVGFLESGLTSSYEMLVAMDEVIAMVKTIMQGAEINTDTLAVDVIDRVGPGGNFLTEKHTVKYMRGGWFPTLMDRQNYVSWEADGKKSMGDRLKIKVQKILNEHKPAALEPDALNAIKAIVRKADEEYAG
ncbi:MAG: trimethylamine methyltransferase family protein [Anaerolineales bacterium]|nr:trimethylamine methyltransferase family protein [Anaerolineales bacterium]